MKSIIQVWVVVIVSGVIGTTALNWNGGYEKGSPIDIIKTQVQRGAK